MEKGEIITLANLKSTVEPEDILEVSSTERVAIIPSSKEIRSGGLIFRGKKYFPKDFIWLGTKIGILI